MFGHVLLHLSTSYQPILPTPPLLPPLSCLLSSAIFFLLLHLFCHRRWCHYLALPYFSPPTYLTYLPMSYYASEPILS